MNNLKQLKQIAHKSKSAFAIFGFEKLSCRMKAIEDIDSFDDIEKLKNEIIDIFNNLLKLFDELEDYMRGNHRLRSE